MAKRSVNFDAFDRELAESKPELAARIGAVPNADESSSAPPPPALRVVPSPDVQGVADAPPPVPIQLVEPAPEAPPATNKKLRGRVRRADGSESGRQIVYLPIDLDERLRRYAFESGRSLTDVSSELLSEAIRSNLP